MTCDVITAVLFEGEIVCVTMTSDVITSVLFQGVTGCVRITCDVIKAVLFEGESVCVMRGEVNPQSSNWNVEFVVKQFTYNLIFLYFQDWEKSQDGVVGIAFGYRLIGLGIESQRGVDIFLANPTSPKSQPASVQWVAILSQGLNGPQCGADHLHSPITGLLKGQRYTSTSSLCPPPDKTFSYLFTQD